MRPPAPRDHSRAMPAPALSSQANARLRTPRTRGAFAPIDAARRQLGLLAVADRLGQARISWLINLETQVIEDARFLAFGSLASHPLTDAFTELARGRTVADACALRVEQIDSLLRDDPLTPAVADHSAYDFLADLQERALAELPTVKLLPKPAEKVIYQRKRKQDWTAADEAWLPLSLLKKIAKVEGLITTALTNFAPGAVAEVGGLHDDLRVAVTFTGLATEQVPTVIQKLTDTLRQSLHPEILVEEAGK